MATVQLNVRMDSALKSEGDLALSRVGYSPTSAVRALWEYARRCTGDAESLRALLKRLDGDEEADARSNSEMDVAEQVTMRRAELYDRIGVPLKPRSKIPATAVAPDDLQHQVEKDEFLLMEAYAERAAEREL